MTFRCDRCARCCRYHRVPVTRRDVSRIVAKLLLDAADFVELTPPDEVDLVGEPESFAELPGGRRVALLAQQDGACVFLADGPAGGACSIHELRPSSCRTYPFDRPDEDDASATPQGRRTPAPDLPTKDLGLHPELLCPPSTGCARVLAGGDEHDEFVSLVAERDAQISAHAAWLTRWNRAQKTRRSLGKPFRTADEFLDCLSHAPVIREHTPLVEVDVDGDGDGDGDDGVGCAPASPRSQT